MDEKLKPWCSPPKNGYIIGGYVLLATLIYYSPRIRKKKWGVHGGVRNLFHICTGTYKKWIGCLLEDLRAFGINGRLHPRARGNRARRYSKGRNIFSWRNGSLQRKVRAGLWHAEVRSMPERDGKDSSKKASVLALVRSPKLMSH